MNKVETIQLGPQPVATEQASPAAALALFLLALGSSMAVAGVYILCGIGWALNAGSVPITIVAVAMLRGAKRGA